MLEVLIVRGYHTAGSRRVETLQQSFGYGSSYLRLGAAAELIDEQQALVIALLKHDFHVEQVGRIGAKVVFYGLLIAYIYEYVIKQAYHTALIHAHRHAALIHVLQQSHSLETNRLSSGIRPGNQQNPLPAVQPYIQRHYFLAMLLQRKFQQRMHCIAPIYDL